MDATESKIEIEARMEVLKREIGALSAKLRELNEQKESKYKEKDAIDKQLNSFIRSAKELRDKKKALDDKVRMLKQTREVMNKGVKELWQQFDKTKVELLGPKQKPQEGERKRFERKLNPKQIQEQIDKLQFSIETEGLSFDREKVCMERIKLLRKQLEELRAEDKKRGELRAFRDRIKAEKVQADSAHEDVQKLAQESTELFSQLSEKSQAITKIKEQRKVLQEGIRASKAELEGTNTQLAELLKQWGELAPQLPAPAEIPVITASEAIEKLREKKKLTKEDLLAIQKESFRKK